MTTPEVSEFLRRASAAAADIGLALTGEPDDRVVESLRKFEIRLAASLEQTLGAPAAAKVAEACVKAALATKLEIETTSGAVKQERLS